MSTATTPRTFLNALADHNPFYLLSAASMLLACLLLSNTTTWEPIASSRLVGLIATLGVYEMIVTLLGVYLIAARRLARDGVMLLVLEAFFLADIGFLSSEAYQQSLYNGLLLNALLCIAGLAKLLIIFHALRVPIASPAFGLIVITLGILLGHPAWLKFLGDSHHGRVSEMTMYGVWWTLAALLAAWGILLRHMHWRFFHGTTLPRVAIVHVIMGVLLASLIAHVGTSHWVFGASFRAMNLSPILLGLTVLLASTPTSKFFVSRDVRTLCVVLPIVAILLSGNAKNVHTLTLFSQQFTPVLFAVAGGYLAIVYAMTRRYFFAWLSLGLVTGLGYAVLPSWESIQLNGTRLLSRVGEVIAKLIPRTQVAWGVIALVGSFGLLAAGALLSLRKRELTEPASPTQIQ